MSGGEAGGFYETCTRCGRLGFALSDGHACTPDIPHPPNECNDPSSCPQHEAAWWAGRDGAVTDC